MKNIFKTLALIIVIGAVVGAVILVQRNQETRRGAAGAESSVSVLPAITKAKVGENLSVQLMVNSGSSSEILSAVELNVSFSSDKLRFVEFSPSNGFELLTKSDNGNGGLSLKMVRVEKGDMGAVSVGKITFSVIKNGQATVNYLQNGLNKIVVLNQDILLYPSKFFGSTVTISGTGVASPTSTGLEPEPIVTAKPTATGLEPETLPRSFLSCNWCGSLCVDSRIKRACTTMLPPTGYSCVSENNRCVSKLLTTARPTTVQGESGGLEGDFCGGLQNVACADGLFCDRSSVVQSEVVSVPEGSGVCRLLETDGKLI